MLLPKADSLGSFCNAAIAGSDGSWVRWPGARFALWRREGVLEIGRHVSLAVAARDPEAEYLRGEGPHRRRGLIMLAGFDLSQGAQQFGRFDFPDGAVPDFGFPLTFEPAVALEGRL